MTTPSFYPPFMNYWLVAMRACDLKKDPVRRMILGTPLVFYRHDGGIAAMLDRCPHRNAPLSAGTLQGSCITCPYHGWAFTPQGTCSSIPGMPDGQKISAPQIPTYPIQEQGGFIWVYKGEGEPYRPPYIGAPIFEGAQDQDLWHLTITGDLINSLENFLDGTHTHFVHAGLIRSPQKRRPVTAHLTGFENAVQVRYSHEGAQSGLISRLFEQSRGDSFGRFFLPGIAELEFRTATQTSLMITVYFTPETPTTFSVHAAVRFAKTRVPSWIKKILIYPFFKRALTQDLHILSQQQSTIALFGGPSFFSTSLDIIRPSICQLLDGKSLEGKKKTVMMSL